MPSLNSITHPNPFVQKKVNFFADYFHFLVNNQGKAGLFFAENHLSIVEKIVNQVKNNINNCPPHVDNYLSHSLIQENDNIIKKYPQRSKLFYLISEYKKEKRQSKKIDFLRDSEFYNELVKFRTYLKRYMFKHSLKSIISYLKCIHEIDYHIYDLKYYTEIIVSEFILTKRDDKEIISTLKSLFSKEISEFPFPPKLNYANENDYNLVREEFIKNRTFDQQFEGLHNKIRHKQEKVYFIFRVSRIEVPLNFKFTYNKVTFYNPQNSIFQQAFPHFETYEMLKKILGDKKSIIAVVNIDYHSQNIAEQEAINIINTEVQFLNSKLKSNGIVERFLFAQTTDFISYKWMWRNPAFGTKVKPLDVEKLNQNPYSIFSKKRSGAKQHFLSNESLYIKAINSKNIADYWTYLEALIPKEGKELKNTLANILVLSPDILEKRNIGFYILNLIINSSSEELGISPKIWKKIQAQISYKRMIKLLSAKHKYGNSFMNFLLDEFSTTYDSNSIIIKKIDFQYLLSEFYTQRNSIVHDGQAFEKSIILLNSTIPLLIENLRAILIASMIENPKDTFIELIKRLNKSAESYLG